MRKSFLGKRFEYLEHRFALDGQPAMLADLTPGAGSSAPTQFLGVGDAVYFITTQGDSRGDLWRTAPGESVTHFSDLDLGARPTLVEMGGNVYVTAKSASHPGELLRVDHATGAVTTIYGQPGSSNLTPQLFALDDRIFFVADNALWVSDGTAAGTHAVQGAVGVTQYLGVTDHDLYFTAHGAQVWRTDGTEDGTRLVTELGTSSAPVELMFLSSGDTAYFAHISIGDTAIWRTDGSAAGTIKVDDEAGALMPLTTVDDTLYFKAILSNDAWELWRLGPADTEPTVVKQFDSSAISPYAAAFGGKLYFYSHTKTSDLWVSDGTAEGTMPVADAASSVWPRFIDQVISTSERLYVIDHGVEHNWRFWESDGTAAGTRLIGEFEMPRSLTAIGSDLYFDLHTEQYGSEPWVLRSATNPPGDLNGDSKIDLSDFGILKANFGTANALGDIDRNGQVDLSDFGLLKQAYGAPVDTTIAQAALRAAAVDIAIRSSVTDE